MRPKTAGRLAWSIWGAAALAQLFWLAAQVLFGEPGETTEAFSFSPLIIAFGTVGALIASRRPDNRIGWVYLLVQVEGTLLGASLITASLMSEQSIVFPWAVFAAWLQNWLWIAFFVSILPIPILLFPTGKPLSSRWRNFLWLLIAYGTVQALISAVDPVVEAGVGDTRYDNPIGLSLDAYSALGSISNVLDTVGMFLILLSVVSMVQRWRRSKGVERQQLKWFVFAAAMLAVLIPLDEFVLQIPDSIGNVLFPLMIAGIPAASGIAILRHRLLDIDVVINKAVAYAILATFITAVFALVVVAPAVLVFGVPQANLLLPLVATAAVALAFQPARRRAQQFANRLVYGQRVTPYEAMAEFSHQMAGSLSVEQVLPRIAETAARGVGASRSHVAVVLPSGEERSADWPTPNRRVESFAASVPVVYRDERIGEIAVAKPPGDPLTSAEQKLLSDLASQAGSALANVRLTEELRASRQRLVKAQDEERRKLERNLHDGAQQQLVALKVQLGLAARIADPESKVGPMLSKLAEDANDAIENLRELARGIYPPLLADRGLAEAVSSHAQRLTIPVGVSADSIGRYPQEVESAIYFCCLEALQNISKYANASSVEIEFAQADGDLAFSVRDDGVGFDPVKAPRGAGLQNMRDRIDALGGTLHVESSPGAGTSIRGRVPPIVQSPQ